MPQKKPKQNSTWSVGFTGTVHEAHFFAILAPEVPGGFLPQQPRARVLGSGRRVPGEALSPGLSGSD